jgi:hypothetical protein
VDFHCCANNREGEFSKKYFCHDMLLDVISRHEFYEFYELFASFEKFV